MRTFRAMRFKQTTLVVDKQDLSFLMATKIPDLSRHVASCAAECRCDTGVLLADLKTGLRGLGLRSDSIMRSLERLRMVTKHEVEMAMDGNEKYDEHFFECRDTTDGGENTFVSMQGVARLASNMTRKVKVKADGKETENVSETAAVISRFLGDLYDRLQKFLEEILASVPLVDVDRDATKASKEAKTQEPPHPPVVKKTDPKQYEQEMLERALSKERCAELEAFDYLKDGPVGAIRTPELLAELKKPPCVAEVQLWERTVAVRRQRGTGLCVCLRMEDLAHDDDDDDDDTRYDLMEMFTDMTNRTHVIVSAANSERGFDLADSEVQALATGGDDVKVPALEVAFSANKPLDLLTKIRVSAMPSLTAAFRLQFFLFLHWMVSSRARRRQSFRSLSHRTLWAMVRWWSAQWRFYYYLDTYGDRVLLYSTGIAAELPDVNATPKEQLDFLSFQQFELKRREQMVTMDNTRFMRFCGAKTDAKHKSPVSELLVASAQHSPEVALQRLLRRELTRYDDERTYPFWSIGDTLTEFIDGDTLGEFLPLWKDTVRYRRPGHAPSCVTELKDFALRATQNAIYSIPILPCEYVRMLKLTRELADTVNADRQRAGMSPLLSLTDKSSNEETMDALVGGDGKIYGVLVSHLSQFGNLALSSDADSTYERMLQDRIDKLFELGEIEEYATTILPGNKIVLKKVSKFPPSTAVPLPKVLGENAAPPPAAPTPAPVTAAAQVDAPKVK
jgi:hypothetical protein